MAGISPCELCLPSGTTFEINWNRFRLTKLLDVREISEHRLRVPTKKSGSWEDSNISKPSSFCTYQANNRPAIDPLSIPIVDFVGPEPRITTIFIHSREKHNQSLA